MLFTSYPRARQLTRAALLSLILAALSLPGCLDADPDHPEGWVWEQEEAARDRYFAASIALGGRVIDSQGRPVQGASVVAQEQTAGTDAEGRFLFDDLTRDNTLITIEHADFYSPVLPTQLALPLSTEAVEMGDITLDARSPDTTRLLFSGDVSMGRRFLRSAENPPTDRLPDDDPEALIQVSDPFPGTRNVVQQMRPLFQRADYTIINLETVVTDDPRTPYEDKTYIFFTLPDSLDALSWMGVDYAGLGNNHLYDYFDAGVADTLYHLDQRAIAHSGAGLNAEEAFRAHRKTLGNTPYAFLSMTSIVGSQYAIPTVASDTQGGPANLRDTDAVRAALDRELAEGFVPITIMHAGVEYAAAPSNAVLDRIELARAQGSPLIVAHHPHVAQGFAYEEGTLMAHSLGNFIFDQNRLETLLGTLMQVDMRRGQPHRATAIPVYLKDYRPRHVTGRLADLFVRRLGEASAPFDTPVIARHGLGTILLDPASAESSTRTLSLDVTIDDSGSAILDLRGHAQTDASISALTLPPAITSAKLGHDILLHGDFEDHDIGPERLDPTHWYYAGSSFPCIHETYRGTTALCSTRSSTNTADSVITFRNRIRVDGDATHEPNKDLTLIGYISGQNAGPVTLEARYYASSGDREFPGEFALRAQEGTYGWTAFSYDLSMPPEDPNYPSSLSENARATRFFLHHSPPEAGSGEGVFRIDELALITWRDALDADAAQHIAAPNTAEFIRVSGPPGSYTIEVELTRHHVAP
ncbi:CapA family protein [Lujinxingia vulgaris]|nr:CapA family protein [Lujinxingia vulgaris]